MSDDPFVFGLDLGGTRLKAVVATPDGTELARRTVLTGGDDWQEQVKQAIDALRAELGEPAAIGVAAPGLPAADRRSIAHMPGRLPGLEGWNWGEALGAIHDVPVMNDAQAALLGEIWQGAAKGEENVILLTLGTGVGGAAMVDGNILRGHLSRAGHFGHITVNSRGPVDDFQTPGSLELALGNFSLGQRSGGKFSATSDLVAAMAAGDLLANEIWERMMTDLGAGVTSLINVLDPAVVVIGGGIAEAGETLFEPLRARLDEFEWRPQGAAVRLARAELGDWAGALGAARSALLSLSSS